MSIWTETCDAAAITKSNHKIKPQNQTTKSNGGVGVATKTEKGRKVCVCGGGGGVAFTQNDKTKRATRRLEERERVCVCE